MFLNNDLFSSSRTQWWQWMLLGLGVGVLLLFFLGILLNNRPLSTFEGKTGKFLKDPNMFYGKLFDLSGILKK